MYVCMYVCMYVRAQNTCGGQDRCSAPELIQLVFVNSGSAQPQLAPGAEKAPIKGQKSNLAGQTGFQARGSS